MSIELLAASISAVAAYILDPSRWPMVGRARSGHAAATGSALSSLEDRLVADRVAAEGSGTCE